MKTSGSGTLSYQWVRDEVPITDEQQLGCAGAMTNSLKFNSLLPEHSGNYMCIVTNSSGVSRSKPAELQGRLFIVVTSGGARFARPAPCLVLLIGLCNIKLTA